MYLLIANGRVWNHLPTDVRQLDLSSSHFRQSQKTYLVSGTTAQCEIPPTTTTRFNCSNPLNYFLYRPFCRCISISPFRLILSSTQSLIIFSGWTSSSTAQQTLDIPAVKCVFNPLADTMSHLNIPDIPKLSQSPFSIIEPTDASRFLTQELPEMCSH